MSDQFSHIREAHRRQQVRAKVEPTYHYHLSQAVETARGLVSRGLACKEFPALVGWYRDSSDTVQWVVTTDEYPLPGQITWEYQFPCELD